MSLNSTPTGDRIHIGFFGKRNAGKSSLINAVTNQSVSIVSDVSGTTTDPVYKTMEILPLGPTVIIDTPGIDDVGELGEMRVKRTKSVLNKTDVAVIIADARVGITSEEEKLIELIKDKNISYIIAYNKCDLLDKVPENKDETVYVSAQKNIGIEQLKEKIASLNSVKEEKFIVSDLIDEKDLILLVVPIDTSAPKGRIILPQNQTIRDILDKNAVSIVCQPEEIECVINSLNKKPRLVITDSQVFEVADKYTPDDIDLTSFSILMARYKGLLNSAVRGVKAIENLKDNDTVLIAEGCTHHRQCEDIGTVKIPALLRKYTGKNLNFENVSGNEFPEDIEKYSLIVHCGGCMLSEREVKYRVKCAEDKNVPITNYGICLGYLKGVLKRGIKIFPDLYNYLY
ncbi:MAG: [FeFe] hydrogenase H-cluster maturation GTPase HydF [Acutalibacteraceae bacterium]|nr:[FeFe] hydrogenase H-cluster maturation GTPase HydF [Acutalibacteraceae bacterium]